MENKKHLWAKFFTRTSEGRFFSTALIYKAQSSEPKKAST